MPAATLFVNGRFWPSRPSGPDAAALAVRDGRIVLAARSEEEAAAALAGQPAERVDLEGRTAIPGPVDSHCHLVSYGMIRLREAELRGAATVAEIAARLAAQAELLGLRPGDGRWLLGRGFDQELMPGEGWPTRGDLDAIAPDRPLRITRVCGHAMVANTAALRAAGLDPGARHGGFPPGVLTESDMAPMWAATPEPTGAEWLQAARWACGEAARVGFTGVHSLMAHAHEMRALMDLRAEGPLPVRVQMQPPYAMLDALAASGLRSGFGDDWLTYGAVKLFSDGSLGARTAALEEPYADAPEMLGTLIYPAEELDERVRRVAEAGWQVCVHAIGDRAMRLTLDAMERAAANGPGWVLPPRIEHASMVNPALLERMRRLRVGAAIQPQFARSDFWAPDRLGHARAKGCYAFRSLHEAGIPLAGSTDCPVEAMDAMAAIGQLVHRPDWSPDEGLPLDTALRVFSEGSYALRGMPAGTGSLRAGQFADFVVLAHDPRTVPPAEIERIPVAMTVVGGAISHRA